MSDTDGVLHLVSGKIRQIQLKAQFANPEKPKDKIEKSIAVDLQPDPEPHPSHAIVTTDPILPSIKSFQKLQQKLRDQAQWALEPDQEKISTLFVKKPED